MRVNRLVLAALMGLVVVVPTALLAQARAPQPGQTGQNGRFVMMSPPAAAQGNVSMDNFSWVLDTHTGAVKAHRIMQVKNDKGELSYWAYQELVDYDALAAKVAR
jgi:hypothetical protein